MNGTQSERSAGRSTSVDGPDRQPAAGGAAERMELRQERLRVQKTPEQAGSVHVGRQISEREETLSVPLQAEYVVVQRGPGDGRVLVDGRELGDGETIELPILHVVAAIKKDVVVVEEVAVRREVLQRETAVSETVGREELVVDDPQGLAHEVTGQQPGPQTAAGRRA